MPAAAPSAQPEETVPSAPQKAPSQPEATTSTTPIGRTYRKVSAAGQRAAGEVVQTTKSMGDRVRSALKYEPPTPAEVGIIRTPFYAAGHGLDGTALNVVRRGVEVAEPAFSLLRSAYRCTIGKILHPIKTITHPVETVKDFVHLGTSAVMMPKQMAMAAVRAPGDFVTRSVDNANQQINFKTKKVPVIGKLYSKVSNWVSGLGRKITNGIRKGVEWATGWIDNIHDATAPA